ncbi:hypothetical protein FSARC_8229 [Fusarium sarcochroum]|uniref:Uncharacterized protein n=1 Tax=Fusarium sarcochroum TaxID=1208366 RepID=A0A8H4X756_9HYPO|nr:hypothetical protein FSARC_8229 [Fusarium sarcochroum]
MSNSQASAHSGSEQADGEGKYVWIPRVLDLVDILEDFEKSSDKSSDPTEDDDSMDDWTEVDRERGVSQRTTVEVESDAALVRRLHEAIHGEEDFSLADLEGHDNALNIQFNASVAPGEANLSAEDDLALSSGTILGSANATFLHSNNSATIDAARAAASTLASAVASVRAESSSVGQTDGEKKEIAIQRAHKRLACALTALELDEIPDRKGMDIALEKFIAQELDKMNK